MKSMLFKKMKALPLVDRCILIFMLQLLITLTLTIFCTIPNSSEYSNLDVVFRTSTANIFGYILSSNFMHTPIQKPMQETSASNTVQILVTTLLGMFCILVLTCVRFQAFLFPTLEISSANLTTLSQFRDFISGCTGFLIGIPKDK